MPKRKTHGGARPGAGRKPTGRPTRSESVTVYLTSAELAALTEAVARENAELASDGAKPATTVSSWMRDHALDPLGLQPIENGD